MRHISTIEPLQYTVVFSDTGDYNGLGEVNILVITPLSPRMQG
jgi:hypothetical protein